MIPNENSHFGHSTHTISLYFFAIFSRLRRTNFSQIPQALFTQLIGLALLFSLSLIAKLDTFGEHSMTSTCSIAVSAAALTLTVVLAPVRSKAADDGANYVQSVSFSLTSTGSGQTTSCQVTVPSCPSHPESAGTHPDDWQDPGYTDSSGSDQAECMQRAQDYYDYCNTTTPVTASYLVNGVSVQTTTYPSQTSGGGGGGGEIQPSFFGLHFFRTANFSTVTASFGTLRIWDTGAQWSQVCPDPSCSNWGVFDQYINFAQAHNLDVVYNLGPSHDFRVTWDDPTGTNIANIANWEHWVTTVVTRNAG